MSSKRRFSDDRVAGILGLAFDADDGHKRITRGKNFLLAGGSDQTHGLMRDTIIKVTEQLDDRGQSLSDVTVNELRDLIDRGAGLNNGNGSPAKVIPPAYGQPRIAVRK